MKKFEKVFFNILTKEMNFFIRDYYSKYNDQSKWLSIRDIDKAYVVVLVVKDSEEEIIYNEVREYLSNTLNKPFIINLIVLASGEYLSFGKNYYNKLVFSLKDRNVIYCSEGSKSFLSIIDYMVRVDTNNNNKNININRETIKKYKFTYSLMLLNIVIFLIEILKSKSIFNIDAYTLIDMGAKINVNIYHGEYYRLFTAAFLHGGIIHILFNLYALNIIGKEVEYVYGWKRFLLIYFTSALGGNVFSYIFTISNPISISVGASGAIFGLLGAMLVFGIKEKDKIGKEYSKNIFKLIVINVIIGITISNIDNFAHVGGLLVGFLISFILFNKKVLLS